MKYILVLAVLFCSNTLLAQQASKKKDFSCYNLFCCSTTPPEYKDKVDRLGYFVGNWDLELTFVSNQTNKPDIKAVWTVKKCLNGSAFLLGHVALNNNFITNETISYNPVAKYTRFITVNDSTRIIFIAKGWKKDKLVWQGVLHNPHSTIVMREIIKKISDNEFRATYYQRKKRHWEEMQTEVLKRIPSQE